MALTSGINVNGDKPFEEKDFTKPNLAYFEHIRKGIRLAGEKGLLVGMAPVWKGCCNDFWNPVILENGTGKCREYGRFIGKYFAGCTNLFWIQGGDNDPKEQTDHYREIAIGIRESMPDVLQTYHASTGHSSTNVLPNMTKNQILSIYSISTILSASNRSDHWQNPHGRNCRELWLPLPIMDMNS